MTSHFFCQISSSSVAFLFISFIIFACKTKSAFLFQESSSDLQASLFLSAICEMVSTVLTSSWKVKFPRSHKKNRNQLNFYKLKSPTFGNEKVKFRLIAESDGPNSGAQIFLYFDYDSTIHEIVANIEYRTSKVEEFDGKFKSLKKIELSAADKFELTTANFEFKKDAFSHPNCDLYFVHIEVRITIFDNEDSSFLNTWNSPGSNNSVDHADTLCQNLAVFGAESSLADVTVCTVADGEEFKVHSSILTMRSPVFAAMFAEGSFKESQEKKVYIEDFCGQVIGAFIDYLYGRKNTEWKSFAGELAEVADKYDVPSLFKACAISLVADINVENAAKNFSHAYQLEMSDSIPEIAQFIFENKAAIMATDGWIEYFSQDVKLYDALYKAT